MSRIVVTVHYSASIEIGQCFERRHIVEVSDEDGIQSPVQLFGEFIGPARDKHLRWTSGYFVVVATPAVPVIVDGVLQVSSVVCVAVPDCVVRLHVTVNGIGEVTRKEWSVDSGSSGMILLKLANSLLDCY